MDLRCNICFHKPCGKQIAEKMAKSTNILLNSLETEACLCFQISVAGIKIKQGYLQMFLLLKVIEKYFSDSSVSRLRAS